MYDNFYTKYEDAKIFINDASAKDVIKMLEKEKHLTAEQCAYLSKAYVFAGDDKNAVKYAKKAVKINPEYAYGYIRLAFALASLDKKKECLKNVMLAEKFGANDWLVQSFLVPLYHYLDDEEKYEYYTKKLFERNLDSPEYYFNAGSSFYMLYAVDYKKSVELFEKAKDYKDRYSLYSRLLRCYIGINDIENAYYYLEKCLSIKETQEFLEYRIIYLIYFEKYDEAENFSRELYRKGENKQQALLFIGSINKDLKRYKKALRYLRFADYTTEATEYLYSLMAEIYEAKADYYSAIDFYKKALKFAQNDDVKYYYYSLSYCYIKTKHYDLSLEFVNRAIFLDKNNPDAYYKKACVLQEMEKYEEAITFYEKGIEFDCSNDAYANISLCYSKLGDLKKSLLYANKALMINKDYAFPHSTKAVVLHKLGKFDEAIDDFIKTIELEPTIVFSYLGITGVFLDKEDYASALEYANKAILLDRYNGCAYYYKSVALSNLGKKTEAEKIYAKARQLGFE